MIGGLKLALRANVGRIVCNMPHAHANSGGWNTGLPTTDTLGCGSWAGNIFSGNINWENFLNYTLLSIPKEEYIPTVRSFAGSTWKNGVRTKTPNRSTGDIRMRIWDCGLWNLIDHIRRRVFDIAGQITN